MMVEVTTRFVDIPGNLDHTAHYVLTGDALKRITINLAANPFPGMEVPGRRGLFEYRFRVDIVAYASSPDSQTVYLLTLRPHDVPHGSGRSSRIAASTINSLAAT